MEDLQNEELEQQQTPIQHAVKFGAIVGMISAIVTILLYVINPALMINMWIGLGFMLIFLGIVVYGGITYRKEIGGYIEFGPAYIHGFVVLVTMGIIGLMLNLLLHNVIDTTLGETLTEAGIEQSVQMMEKFGAPQDAIDEAIEKQREDFENQFTNAGIFKSSGYAVIAYAVVALITGLIVRRREKVSDVM